MKKNKIRYQKNNIEIKVSQTQFDKKVSEYFIEFYLKLGNERKIIRVYRGLNLILAAHIEK